MIITTLFCSISIFGLWLFCGSSEAAITVFAILFCFWSGACISLTAVCVAQICRIEDYSKRNGTAYSLSSFAALIGAPIAGPLVDARGGDYIGFILFGGCLYAAAMLVSSWPNSFYGRQGYVPDTKGFELHSKIDSGMREEDRQFCPWMRSNMQRARRYSSYNTLIL